MDPISPVSIKDFEDAIFLSVARIREELPRILAGPSMAGWGVVFDPSVQKFVLHGTTIASFFVEEGKSAVVVSDGKVSENALLQAASLEFEKLIEIDSHTVMAVSGSAGFAMLYARMLKSWVETMEKIREQRLSSRSKVNMLTKILRENLSLSLSGLIVIPILTTCDDKRGPRIFFLTPDGSAISKKTYAISGSGKVSEGYLQGEWRMNLSKEEGINLAKNLVKSARNLDGATGGKIFIKVVSRDGIESVDGGWASE